MDITASIDDCGLTVGPFNSVMTASVSMPIYKMLFLPETWEADRLANVGLRRRIPKPGWLY